MQLRHAKSDCWKARRRQTKGKKSQLSKLNASRRQDKENQPPVSSQSQTSSLHGGITDRISPLHRQLDEINALSHTYERRRVICRGKITSAAAAEPKPSMIKKLRKETVYKTCDDRRRMQLKQNLHLSSLVKEAVGRYIRGEMVPGDTFAVVGSQLIGVCDDDDDI